MTWIIGFNLNNGETRTFTPCSAENVTTPTCWRFRFFYNCWGAKKHHLRHLSWGTGRYEVYIFSIENPSNDKAPYGPAFVDIILLWSVAKKVSSINNIIGGNLCRVVTVFVKRPFSLNDTQRWSAGFVHQWSCEIAGPHTRKKCQKLILDLLFLFQQANPKH